MLRVLLVALGLSLCLALVVGASPAGTTEEGRDPALASSVQPVFVAGVDTGGAASQVVKQPAPGNLYRADCRWIVYCSACVYAPGSICNFRVCTSIPC